MSLLRKAAGWWTTIWMHAGPAMACSGGVSAADGTGAGRAAVEGVAAEEVPEKGGSMKAARLQMLHGLQPPLDGILSWLRLHALT